MRSGFDVLDLPYLGPSRVPLLDIYALKERGLWAVRDEPPRDRSTDMTDEQIAAAIASFPTTGRADGRDDMA